MLSSPALSFPGLFYPLLIGCLAIWLARMEVRAQKRHISGQRQLWPSERLALEQRVLLLPVRRAVLLFLFVFYLLCASLLTILPIPDDFSIYCTQHSGRSLVDLNFLQRWADFQRHLEKAGNDNSYWQLILSERFREPFLNILLAVPLGWFLMFLYWKNRITAFFFGVAMILLWELTQLSGLWFIAPCPWRTFSLTDIAMNSLGLVLGSKLGLLTKAVVRN